MDWRDNFMIGLLIGVAGILVYLLFLNLRNPVLVKIGLRNIPRRPAQTVLIVLGLTLSTIIIVSSFATGDTLTYSVRRHAIQAYGKIDEIIAPPLLSLFASSGFSEDGAATTEQTEELNNLMAGGLTSVLTVLEGGLPGISMERLAQLKTEASQDPQIDAVAGSIIFPTIIRNSSTGQGEPLGFIFAVDDDYDQTFGLTTVDGAPVEVESLQTGVSNIFAQAANLFTLVQDAGARLGLTGFSISDVALATAAVGAALTSGASEEGIDLSQISIDVATLENLGIDTSALREAGVTRIDLATLGLTPDTLAALGVTTTTVSLDTVGIDTTGVQSTTARLLGALNLNTMGAELDRVLAQFGLQLRQGDVYLNRLGAEQLNAQVGDVLEVYIGPIPLPFRVKAIVDQSGPMGALLPVVILRLDEAQKLLFMQNKVNNILVSNQGDEVTGMEQTEAVSERLRVLALDPAAVEEVAAILRRPSVRPVIEAQAERRATEFDREFDGPPFLRDLIRDLAQEGDTQQQMATLRQALGETGVSPAFRTLLSDLELRGWLGSLHLRTQDTADLQNALAKLNQFDVLDPLSKATVVTVADVGGLVFSSIFSIFGLLSILAGVLLIFLIFIMMAAERRSEIGMARAIGMQRSHVVQMFVTEGVAYDLAAAALGVLLGLGISYLLVELLGSLFNQAAQQVSGQSTVFRVYFRAAPTSVVIAYCLGVLLTFVIVTLSSWRASRLNIVAAIHDLPEPPGAGRTSRIGRIGRLVFGPLLALAGGVLLVYGLGTATALVQAGATLLLAGVAFFVGWWLERTRLSNETVERWVYSILGVGILLLWTLPWPDWLDLAGADLTSGGPWILLSFALSMPMIIFGAILVVMFNADAWSWALTRLLGGIGPLTPVLRTAIAYPLSARFRTGMAMVLFAMVISTVTLMSVVIHATQVLVAPEEERYAGFDVAASTTLLSFFDPLEDLAAELPQKPGFPMQDVAVIGSVARLDGQGRQLEPSTAPGPAWQRVPLNGVDAGYLDQAATVYSFSRRAPGFADNAAVWDALKRRDDVAVVTADQVAGATGPGPVATPTPQDSFDEGDLRDPDDMRFGSRLLLSGVPDGGDLPDLRVALRRDAEAEAHPVQVIAILKEGTTLAGSGFLMNRSALDKVAGEAVAPGNFYLKVSPGADVHAVAQATERAFLNNAINATVLAESAAQAQALTRGILQVFQGFLALGLLVGIAALGVISTRTVVERRQQVGMLRAIGFQPGMVALSFLLESSFIALTGIGVGTAAGVLLGQSLIGGSLAQIGDQQGFAIPWLQIGGIVLAAYLFSLLTTILPALQAARIYPAEALRYE